MDAERRALLNKCKKRYCVARCVNYWVVKVRIGDGWASVFEHLDCREKANAYRMHEVFHEYCVLRDWSPCINTLAEVSGGTPDEIVERMHQLAAIVYGVEGADR